MPSAVPRWEELNSWSRAGVVTGASGFTLIVLTRLFRPTLYNNYKLPVGLVTIGGSCLCLAVGHLHGESPQRILLRQVPLDDLKPVDLLDPDFPLERFARPLNDSQVLHLYNQLTELPTLEARRAARVPRCKFLEALTPPQIALLLDKYGRKAYLYLRNTEADLQAAAAHLTTIQGAQAYGERLPLEPQLFPPDRIITILRDVYFADGVECKERQAFLAHLSRTWPGSVLKAYNRISDLFNEEGKSLELLTYFQVPWEHLDPLTLETAIEYAAGRHPADWQPYLKIVGRSETDITGPKEVFPHNDKLLRTQFHSVTEEERLTLLQSCRSARLLATLVDGAGDFHWFREKAPKLLAQLAPWIDDPILLEEVEELLPTDESVDYQAAFLAQQDPDYFLVAHRVWPTKLRPVLARLDDRRRAAVVQLYREMEPAAFAETVLDRNGAQFITEVIERPIDAPLAEALVARAVALHCPSLLGDLAAGVEPNAQRALAHASKQYEQRFQNVILEASSKGPPSGEL